MAKHSVFYSFHFDNDVFRVQQVRQMGVIAGKEPVATHEWERIRKSEESIKRWINDTIAESDAVVVLIGSHTFSRPWVKYEIAQAWQQDKPLLGVHIHNLKCPRTGLSTRGRNPFEHWTYSRGGSVVAAPPVYDPSPFDAYGEISKNLAGWVSREINR